MRVAIFAGDYKPVRGGTSISVQLAVKALQRRGAQVHVFTADTPELDGDPVAVPLPSCPVRLGGVRMAMVRPIPARRVAERRARELGIDVVHTFSPFLEGWIARHVATRLEAPLVWTCQTMWLHYLHYVPMWNLVRGTSAEPYLGRAALFWVRRFAEHCSGVVFPTLRTRDALLDGSPIRARVAILPQGFEVEALRSGDGAKERRELGLEEGKTLLVTVGRMVREKNVDFLLEALAPILRAKRSHLVLAGDGPKRRDYEALAVALKISSSVIFLGHVAYERIPALLAAADVFVFASLSDAQALAASSAGIRS